MDLPCDGNSQLPSDDSQEECERGMEMRMLEETSSHLQHENKFEDRKSSSIDAFPNKNAPAIIPCRRDEEGLKEIEPIPSEPSEEVAYENPYSLNPEAQSYGISTMEAHAELLETQQSILYERIYTAKAFRVAFRSKQKFDENFDEKLEKCQEAFEKKKSELQQQLDDCDDDDDAFPIQNVMEEHRQKYYQRIGKLADSARKASEEFDRDKRSYEEGIAQADAMAAEVNFNAGYSQCECRNVKPKLESSQDKSVWAIRKFFHVE